MAQRRFPRYRVDVPMVVRKMGAGMTGDLRGQSVNLSEGGVGVMMGGGFLPGQVVLMELVLPQSHQPVRVNARFCHRCDSVSGFEFLAAEPHVLESIRQACTGSAA